MLVTSKKSII